MASKYAFASTIHELRFLFCGASEHGAATKSFLFRAYPTMKKYNPSTPILIREATGTEPRVFARYDFGKEQQRSLAGLSDKEIEETVTTLVRDGQR